MMGQLLGVEWVDWFRGSILTTKDAKGYEVEESSGDPRPLRVWRSRMLGFWTHPIVS